MSINLSEKPEILTREPQWFLHLEKVGPFMKTAPASWQEFWQICGPLVPRLRIERMAGLSHIDASKQGDERFTYQAGVVLAEKPQELPGGVQLRQALGGRYAVFVLSGSYHQLPDAYPKAFSVLEKEGFKLRDDFCAEIYLNTPQDTAEVDLRTQILIPIV